MLYDLDLDEPATQVYASYADAKADAEGLNNVLILKLTTTPITSEPSADPVDDLAATRAAWFLQLRRAGVLPHLASGLLGNKRQVGTLRLVPALRLG